MSNSSSFLKEMAATLLWLFVVLVLLAAVLSLVGCDGVTIGEPRPNLQQTDQPVPDRPYGPDGTCPDGSCPNGACPVDRPCTDAASPYRLVPPVDLPVQLRQPNYAGGSCMYAAFCDVLRWQGLYDVADHVRQSYRGGQVVSGLAGVCDGLGLKFAFTTEGDESFLAWCSRTRRGAVIHWRVSSYSDHAITFCGYDDQQQACLIDNNATKKVKRMPKASFLAEWHRNGGKALTVVYDPYPPRPWAPTAAKSRDDATLCGRRVAVRVGPGRVDVRWPYGRVYVPTPYPYGYSVAPPPPPYFYPVLPVPDGRVVPPPLPYRYRTRM